MPATDMSHHEIAMTRPIGIGALRRYQLLATMQQTARDFLVFPWIPRGGESLDRFLGT
jgi:hypothetical protein